MATMIMGAINDQGPDRYHGDSMAPDSSDAAIQAQILGESLALQRPPAPKVPRNTIPANPPFSMPYKSSFTTKTPPTPEVLGCLNSVNCSYLSSGVAPSLLELKQHAQSLTVLIRELTVSQNSAIINNVSSGLSRSGPFSPDSSFDFLNDLTRRYENHDPHHSQPLTSILNTIEEDPYTHEPRNICPLKTINAEGPGIQPHPYTTHENLIRHANEILSRLDHEYSARGGLLSIFPTSMQKEDREKAEKTVLGQMIFWVQNLVQRIHHLERLYANSMDLLAKEAVVPTETLSALGARGRKGREVVYPQDRFVLVNAGEDLWDFLNAEFERKEVIDIQVDARYRELGTTGEAIWADRGGKEFAKGITAIDVYTRYYRLRDSDLKTIFVIPAHEVHPGVKVTREMEKQPTVVSVVKPVWPERLSVLETKQKEDLRELKHSRHELDRLKHEMETHDNETRMLRHNNLKLKQEKRILVEQKDSLEKVLHQSPNQTKLDVFTDLGKASEARHEAARIRAIYEKQIQDTAAAKFQAEQYAREMKEAREKEMLNIKKKEEIREEIWSKKIKQLEDRDKDLSRAAQETIPKLKAVWLKQMTESQVLVEFLASREAQEKLRDVDVPDHVREKGKEKATALFMEAAKDIEDSVPLPISMGEEEDSDDEEEEYEPAIATTTTHVPVKTPPTTPAWRDRRHTRPTRPSTPSQPKSLNTPRSPKTVKFSKSLESGPATRSQTQKRSVSTEGRDGGAKRSRTEQGAGRRRGSYPRRGGAKAREEAGRRAELMGGAQVLNDEDVVEVVDDDSDMVETLDDEDALEMVNDDSDVMEMIDG